MEATTAPTNAPTSFGSDTVKALERVYTAIRNRHPELPEHIVIVTGSGLTARGAKWGHFGADRWVAGGQVITRHLAGMRLKCRVKNNRMPEMFIGGERLECGAELTVQTMIHECAHALADARGICDCSNTGRHNKEFLKLAEEMGLTYPHGNADAQLGYSQVVLTDATKAEYATEIAALNDAITTHLDTLKRLGLFVGGAATGIDTGHGTKAIKAPRKGADRNYVKMVCECESDNIIRMSPKKADNHKVMCSECGAKFVRG